MFGFDRLFRSCGSGCQMLWSDPEKTTAAYDVVNKDESEILNEYSPEEEPLSPEDIVTAQPVWTDRQSSVKNKAANYAPPYFSPIVKNISQSVVFSESQSSRNQSNVKNSVVSAHPSRRSHSVQLTGATASVFSSPIVKSSVDLEQGLQRNSFKPTRKKKSEEVKLQIVSVV